MKLRYVAKTTPDGYSFVFRNVLEFKFMAAARFLSVQLEGKRIDLNGVTSFEGGGDFDPRLPDFTMVPPKVDGGKAEEEKPSATYDEEEDSESLCFEFPREYPVPVELATTTFAPLEYFSSGKVSASGGIVNKSVVAPCRIVSREYVVPKSQFDEIVRRSIADSRKRGYAN